MNDDTATPDIEGFSQFEFIQRRTYFTLWRARQDALGRSVVIRQVNADTPLEQIQHSEVIAKTLGGLSHSALPKIFDVRLSGSPAFIVEEEPSGSPVSLLAERNKPCDVKTAVSIGLKVSEALDYNSRH